MLIDVNKPLTPEQAKAVSDELTKEIAKRLATAQVPHEHDWIGGDSIKKCRICGKLVFVYALVYKRVEG